MSGGVVNAWRAFLCWSPVACSLLLAGIPLIIVGGVMTAWAGIGDESAAFTLFPGVLVLTGGIVMMVVGIKKNRRVTRLRDRLESLRIQRHFVFRDIGPMVSRNGLEGLAVKFAF